MARITPIWNSPELALYRFDHPPEHEDRAYEEKAQHFVASFVEVGTFDLELAGNRHRVRAGDVMMSHPGMRFRASFEGEGFSDTCISLRYVGAGEAGFGRTWAQAKRPVLKASNRLRYMRWGLARALELGAPMFAEYCASEIFREYPDDGDPRPLFSERKLSWYAERVQAVREKLEAELDRTHTVSELARGVGMSVFHFTRVFAELVGTPPHRYLADARLKAARAMLLEGRGVTETCFACGYNNLSHFSRSFAKRFGLPPSRVAD